MELEDIIWELEQKLLDLRSIIRFLKNPNLAEIWDDLPKQCQKDILLAAQKCDREDVHELVKIAQRESRPIENLGLRDLKQLAREYSINGFSSMNKGALIVAVRNAKRSADEAYRKLRKSDGSANLKHSEQSD